VKEDDKPAEYRTGGYKGLGPTFLDIAKSLGVVCAEIAAAVISAKAQQGEKAEWDDVIQTVFDALADGTEIARVRAGITAGKETKDGDNGKPDKRTRGTGGAPRGFH
jgi:hypothetical protein